MRTVLSGPVVVSPRGPFALRVCAGCGRQLNGGHHAHDGRLSPVYEVAAITSEEHAAVVAKFTARVASLEGTLETIARRRPSTDAAGAAFYRCRKDAREALDAQ